MTRDEILNMPAGREMDALIAEKVMNLRLDWEFAEFHNGEPAVPALRDRYDEWGVLPNYSIDISSAWDVVEKIRHRGLCQVNAWHTDLYQVWLGDLFVVDESAPLAICRAALLCVSSNENQSNGA